MRLIPFNALNRLSIYHHYPVALANPYRRVVIGYNPYNKTDDNHTYVLMFEDTNEDVKYLMNQSSEYSREELQAFFSTTHIGEALRSNLRFFFVGTESYITYDQLMEGA